MKKLTTQTLMDMKEKILSRIYEHHLRSFGNSQGNVFYISDTYPGVWLEHAYDGISWANYMPNDHDISANTVRLYFSNQKPSGQLPCYIWSNKIGYSQTQECVSIGSVSLEAIDQNPNDKTLLSEAYKAVSNWVNWFYNARMPHKTGLIEMFCGYDTGHDNSSRLFELKYTGNFSDNAEDIPNDDPNLPMIAPDMNACFYGNHMALAEMADRLGLKEESEKWRTLAKNVRDKLFEYCYDEADQYFYDTDLNGVKRKIRSISITNVLSEGVCDNDLANEIFERYIHAPNEFWTPYPFPAVSVSDPHWVQNLPGNSWNFYSQGLTALRSMRWLPRIGRTAEMEEVMEKWLTAWANSMTTRFGQELHPLTGEPSKCSQYYSSCMLYLLHSMRRLYGI